MIEFNGYTIRYWWHKGEMYSLHQGEKLLYFGRHAENMDRICKGASERVQSDRMRRRK